MATPGADRSSGLARRAPDVAAESSSSPGDSAASGTIGVAGVLALAFVATAYLLTLVHAFRADADAPDAAAGGGATGATAAVAVATSLGTSPASTSGPTPALAGAAAVPAAELFREADLGHGETLLASHACQACHQRNVGGDGLGIYRPAGRINTPNRLVTMVEFCNTQLGLQLFPEDVTAISAVLNRDHYRFD